MSDREPGVDGEPEGRLADLVLDRAVEALVGLQNADGHWVGELEGDAILSSEYILTHYITERDRVDRDELVATLNFLRRQQTDQGGWALYPGGPCDVSASVKAYLVLKLFGEDPEAPHMVRCREKVRAMGGIRACNTFTKIFLAMVGAVSWSECPAVPPELILFPRWFPVNIYEMSSWSRTIVIPLSLIWALKPTRALPAHATIDELDVDPREAPEHNPVPIDGTSQTWRLVFQSLDRAAKLAENITGRLRRRPLRQLAIRRAVKWMRARFQDSDGLGAIFPPIANSVIAFHALGYPADDPVVVAAWKSLKGLRQPSAREDELRIQPCHSPVWDTAIAVNALGMASIDGTAHPLRSGVEWLLDKEVRSFGDWAEKVRDVEPAGWYFEYSNEFYPDVDDTIMVMMGLARSGVSVDHPALVRAMKWVRAMQSRDGGWGAFDRDNNNEVLTNVPFADHNAMLDPPTADITARTLEMMGMFGVTDDDPAVARAIVFIRSDQCDDGSWWGRWGVNYIYGTWQVLRGLQQIGVNMTERWVVHAANWLESVQNEDGGFGESIASYDDPTLKGQGPTTPSQTAWAIMGLISAGRVNSAAVRRAVDWLEVSQLADGTWEEEYWTGTGFPKVFYLRYHLYRLYFPIMALAMWRDARGVRRAHHAATPAVG